MLENYVDVFEDGTILIWKNAFLNDDQIITSIKLLNPVFGKVCPSDWIYIIKYDKGRREAEVFHGEIDIYMGKINY